MTRTFFLDETKRIDVALLDASTSIASARLYVVDADVTAQTMACIASERR